MKTEQEIKNMLEMMETFFVDDHGFPISESSCEACKRKIQSLKILRWVLSDRKAKRK